MLNFITHL